MYTEFLPVSKDEMRERGWWWYDFLVITGDAYVDHPSFGPTVIARLLEGEGFRVAVLAQPDWHSAEAFAAMGRPKLGVMIGAGNLDSMVAHYTASKKRRSEDFYSPGKKMGLRPDRATIVYSNRAREAFGADTPIIIGGLEASLRRFAHYDYWDDKVRRSMLFDSKADLLTYGMGERQTREIARRLKKKIPISEMTDIPGTAYISRDEPETEHILLPSYEETVEDKREYARATRIEYDEHDAVRGKMLVQKHGDRFLVVNKPAMPLNTQELDAVAELPYTREVHPMYDSMGGVPAIEEVRFSVIHNRGCFGACNFCALAFHQGRAVTSRSHESVIREVEAMTHHPLWKGYVSDVGGPTANFRHPSCAKQEKNGMCPVCSKRCLVPTPCKQLDADHSDYLALLRKLREIPGVKKVFVRSGIRFDYMLQDKNQAFFRELVKYHISGQLKVAPEHCIDSVLGYMGKPDIGVYEEFMRRYRELNKTLGKDQYVVPYLMSSHPGSTLADAVALAEYLKKTGRRPEQVQDFYPTPGTISTCMYYTGLDPKDLSPVYVPRSPKEKAMQRALLQYTNPANRDLVEQALRQAGRTDLIGFGKDCLIRPRALKKEKEAVVRGGHGGKTSEKAERTARPERTGKPGKPTEKAGKTGKYGGGRSEKTAARAGNGKRRGK